MIAFSESEYTSKFLLTEQHAESCLFSEEVGWILEAAAVDKATVLSSFEKAGIPCHLLGQSLKQLKDTRELAGEMVYAVSIATSY